MKFITIPGRDAHATIAGFVFQVNVTILRWLNLKEDQLLELEAGEDVDLIQGAAKSGAEDERILEQLKQLGQQRLTLRSSDALEAVANFCEHRRSNVGAKLAFRFLTTTSIGRERGWPTSDSAIQTWEKVRTGQLKDSERSAAIATIHQFLARCRRPRTISKTSWGSLRNVLSQPNNEELGEIIASFEWATESGNHVAIETEVLGVLEKSDPPRSPEDARRVYQSLFAFVFRLLSTAGTKQLTTDILAAEIKSSTLTQADLLAAARFRAWIDRVDSILECYGKDIEELKGRIPTSLSKTFYEPDTSSEHSGKTGPLFDFAQTLRGRQTTLSDLDSFLKDKTKRIAVLPGRGGIGKTKVLRDWSRARTGWKVLWVSQHGVWHVGTAGEIPAEDTVVIADDAHHYKDLDKLISLVSSQTGKQSLKLIIATRPSGLAYVDELLARLADDNSIVRYKTLRPLSRSATAEISKEMLGSEYASLADRLAEVSKDTPLITVVGGKLIARGQITPDLLANDREFRQIVFSKFGEECSGQLPSGVRSKNELLEVIAAVQPVDDQGEDFVTRASVFLSLRPDQIRRGLDVLEQTEVLIRGGGKLRIVPDLFADYLLETASVSSNGTVNGFADAVFINFEETHLSNLLKNFAELDWRITQQGDESRLLDNIWSSILTRFRQQDAADRSHFLHMARDIVVFQPGRVQKLIQIAMDDPVPPVNKYGILRSTQQDVLVELAPLLGATIFNEKTSTDAFDRLWLLTQNDSEGVSGPAQRTLKEAIGYRKYKHVMFNERILGLVEKRADDVSSYQTSFTPLNLLDELLDREVDTTDLKGRAFSISALPVNYQITKDLRERALRAINHALHAGEPRIAVQAARSLGSVLAEFRPKFRQGVTEAEQAWQDAERLGVLDLLSNRLKAGNISLQLGWKIRRILRRVLKRAGQSVVVRDSATAVQQELPRPELFEMFDVLCTDEYEDNTEEEGYSLPSSTRREHQDAAITSLRERFPEIQDHVQAVEKLLQQAVDARIEPRSVDPVVSQMCRDSAFLSGLSEYALRHPQSLLASVAGIAIRQWRTVDQGQYARYGCLFARSRNISTVGSVASAVCYGPQLDSPIDKDLEILMVLAKRNEAHVLRIVFFGLKRLTKVEAFREPALGLIMSVEIGNHHNLAKEYCDIFGQYGISPALLDRTGVERILANLVVVEKLDPRAFFGFVANVCGIAPLTIITFLKARIDHAQILEGGSQDSDYEAIPHSFSWSTFNAIRNHPEYDIVLRSLLHLMSGYRQFQYQLGLIFWNIGTTDVTTFSVLDEILHTSNLDDTALLIRLIQQAPRNLAVNHPMFAIHVLTECTAQGKELGRAAMGQLVGNCYAEGGFQQVSEEGPVTLRAEPSDAMRTSVAALLAKFQFGSLAFRLYTNIANIRPLSFPSPFPDATGDDDDFEEE